MMFATVLLTLCGTTILLTSCSKDDDDKTTDVGPSPLAGKLSGGAWYNIYEASGIAEDEDPSSVGATYSVVIDIYHFQADGTGDFQRCFFDDDSMEPVMVHGILGHGDFTYSSAADGSVAINLKNNWNQSYPQTWNVAYADDAITAKGVDGQMLTLERADDETQAALNSLVEQNGSSGKTKYYVNDYKPKDVDNTQWMKSLTDSRLVADLSLPGSHDACTAEGW